MTQNSKPPTSAIARALSKSMFLCAVALPVAAWAEVQLTTKEWALAPLCPAELSAIQEQMHMQQGIQPRPFVPVETDADCPEAEVDRLENAARLAIATLSAEPSGKVGDADLGLSHKLYIDKKKYYLQPAIFMAKQLPGDVCTPASHGNRSYQCAGGQRYRKDCHVLVFNDKFEAVGYQRIDAKETSQFFCSVVLAVGVGDATNNLVLATVQYFPIDRKPASTIAQVGQVWRRMTVALRLKLQEDGRVLITQEDGCFGNPNSIDTIADARRALRRCATRSQ